MGRLLFISAIIHVVLLVVLPFVPMLTRDYEPALNVYAVELVDVTGRPAAPVQPPVEEPEAAEPEPPAEEPVVDEEPSIPEDPTPAPRRVVLNPPEREARPTLEERLAERLREQDESRPTPAERPERREESTPAQVGSARVTAARFPYGWYLSIVQGKVSSNWSQPSARLIVEDSLTTSVSFVIKRDGSVHDIRIARSSGRSTVDQSAAKAVRQSVPFPPLPDDYLQEKLDITIDFTIVRE